MGNVVIGVVVSLLLATFGYAVNSITRIIEKVNSFSEKYEANQFGSSYEK
jgi:hypothetical protein